MEVLLGHNKKDDYIYTIAEAHAIDLIAKTISKCEIEVHALDSKDKKIKEVKDDLYWRLNIQPNYNENGTSFLYKLVTRLLVDQKALVIINKDAFSSKLLYVASDFIMSNSILYGKVFSDVTICDDDGNTITMNKKYTQEDAIYYSLINSHLTTAKENFKSNSSKILSTAVKSFIKSNMPKWRLKTPGTQPKMIDAETKQPISYDEYKKKITEGLLSDEEAIVMLADIFDLINLNKDNKKDLTDYEKNVKHICDTVARNWNIPLDIFYGSKTEKSTGNNDFITFAVSPYFELLEDGFNITLVGKTAYLKGEYIQINKMSITHKDAIESADGVYKLMGEGFSRNEVNKFLGLPRIEEPWADEHYITKNQERVKGGE